MMSETVSGMTLEEAYQVDDVDIVSALGGLPAAKEVSNQERGRVSADG
jgi:hypothetical protein